MVKKILLWVVLVLTIVAFAGCGGGGGSSAPNPTSDIIRQVRTGELVTYDVTGKLNVGTSSVNTSGTVTRSTHAGSFASIYGGRPLKLVTEINVKASTGESLLLTSTTFYEQVTSGTVYEYGIDDAIITSTDGGVAPIAYRSPVTIGDSYSYTGHYSDFSTEQNSTTVVLTEAVNNQMSYKIHRVSKDGISSATTDEWFVPSWGYPIKVNTTIGSVNGTWVLTETLRTKNF